MPIYDLIEYSDDFYITGSLFQYYRDKRASDNNGAAVDFNNDNTTDSFKFKEK